MFQTVASMNPGPTAILYIISLGNRYTEEDRGFYERLKSTLGPHLAQYAIIIFTRGDDLKRKNETIEGVLSRAPNHFLEVFEECGRRYLVFDNTADDKQRQVDDLLQLVTKLNEAHGGIPYTCLMYCGEGKDMGDEVVRRLRKVEEDEVKNKKYVQAVEEKRRISQEEVEKQKLEFERESIKHWRKDTDTKINHLETMMQMMIKSSNKQQLIANEKEETMAKEIKELRRTLKENVQAVHDLQEAQYAQQKDQQSIGTAIQNLKARFDQLSWKQLCTIL